MTWLFIFYLLVTLSLFPTLFVPVLANSHLGPPAAGLTAIENLFRNLISISVGLAFVALVAMLVIAGIKFLTSGGEAKALQSASLTVTWALLGILFLVIAWLILQLIAAFTGLDMLKSFDVRQFCAGITQPSTWCPYP